MNKCLQKITGPRSDTTLGDDDPKTGTGRKMRVFEIKSVSTNKREMTSPKVFLFKTLKTSTLRNSSSKNMTLRGFLG